MGETSSASFSCDDDDGGSGVASCEATVSPGGPIADGGPLPTDEPGEYALTVTAVDGAGNTATASSSYAVLAGSISEPVEGGETVSTGEEATPDVPVQTSLEVPEGTSGEVTVRPQETPSGEDPPEGFEFFGEQVVIEAPPATAADPYEVTFTVDASVLDGLAPADVEVFRNGERVLGCTHPSQAVPDPCVIARGFAADDSGDAVIRVRTSSFSTWTLGLRTRPDGVADAYLAPQGLTLTVPASAGVLANDLPTESGADLVAGDLNGQAAARVVLAADGSFTYTPPSLGFVGAETFTYVATQDGARASEPVTVTIIVTPRFATTLRVDPVVVKVFGTGLLKVRVGEVSATLTGPGGVPVSGQSVRFSALGRELCTGVTNAEGRAQCAYLITDLVPIVLSLGVTASYAGNDLYFGTTARNGLVG